MHKKIYKSLRNKKVIIKGYTAYEWLNDPKHLLFSLSRYKFVSEMLEGKKDVLEVGCGDWFKSEIVRKRVKNLYLNDLVGKKFLKNDFSKSYIKNKKFDAIYLLDVFEHMNKRITDKFIKNLKLNLKQNGIIIVGIPTLASQRYASKLSKETHVNCLNKKELKYFFSKHFNNVFTFSMNDEVLHTGYDKMFHYIFALCTN